MEDEIAAAPSHRRLWFAVAVTVAAIPLLVWGNRSDDDDDRRLERSVPSLATVVVPVQRPTFGPPKGVSVVTPSTTSSTMPITTISAPGSG